MFGLGNTGALILDPLDDPWNGRRATRWLTYVCYGRREVLGVEVGTSEAEPIWTNFLRRLTRRGLVASKARRLTSAATQ